MPQARRSDFEIEPLAVRADFKLFVILLAKPVRLKKNFEYIALPKLVATAAVRLKKNFEYTALAKLVFADV